MTVDAYHVQPFIGINLRWWRKKARPLRAYVHTFIWKVIEWIYAETDCFSLFVAFVLAAARVCNGPISFVSITVCWKAEPCPYSWLHFSYSHCLFFAHLLDGKQTTAIVWCHIFFSICCLVALKTNSKRQFYVWKTSNFFVRTRFEIALLLFIFMLWRRASIYYSSRFCVSGHNSRPECHGTTTVQL